MISQASPKQVAGKIRSVHNRHGCPKCQRPFDGGVLAFGLSGSDARWFPDEESASRYTHDRARYVFPIRSGDVTLEEVLVWIDQEREQLDQLLEHIEQQREERRMARAIRGDQSGFETKPFPCADCGWPKRRPADKCEQCGDEPIPLGMDEHSYNRGYGYRD